MSRELNFLDLFPSAGELSEGFIQAGVNPVAHVESDQAACFTLRTRMAYHWLQEHGRTKLYADYLNGNISRSKLYEHVPEQVIKSVINAKIGVGTLSDIFRQVNALVDNRALDLIVGDPPCQAYSIVGRSRADLSQTCRLHG
ncbi:DNA cytosine methyltransferase [Desulfobulbus oligotrophicus]|uniref:DNA cytosine methyltransferase n=1 Tax=Desulfobulbus oligotrophicus TaxID=1909699 RepID=A0A7T6APP6_9BACT|nr:DNA cytosine methyltransferase [Desulfobulbus oligotrophicus]QQG64758.1 DNA cytosine methyltransferase [Desulfobulbus oligotrophicus]